MSLQYFKNNKKDFIYICDMVANKGKRLSSVGIDKSRKGWVAVNITEDDFEINLFSSLRKICNKYSDSESILIDMPVGLPESKDEVRPEKKARKILAERASCVFNVPCRQAVIVDNYKLSNKVNRKVMGKGLSRQSFNIFKGIKEVDNLLQERPEWKNILKESHPELCFAALKCGGDYFLKPVFTSKHTREGQKRRIEIISRYYPEIHEVLLYLINDDKLCSILEDVIDALVLALTGKIGIKNGFNTIPEEPMKDSRGIKMQMVYAQP